MNIDNKCITCKHWSQWNDTPNFGACIYLAVHNHPGDMGQVDGIAPATKSFKELTQHDFAFNTGKHFGCVHHNKKL